MTAPRFFTTELEFRAWLEQNHALETELIVGYYKVKSGIPSMTWSQSVDQALCLGWIDGVRHSIDQNSYQIRFTPRKKESVWSPVNLEKIQKLTEQNLMHQAGIDIYKNRREAKDNDYAFRKKELRLPEKFELQFRQNSKAWEYFEALASSYKKFSIHWVISAVQEKTQLKRLHELISASAQGTNKWKDSKYKSKSKSS